MPKRGENIHKRKDGRWEGRYKVGTNDTGKTKYCSVYGKTYSEVKCKMREVIKAQKIITPFYKERTFEEVLCLWKNLNNLKHKGATETKYDYLIENHIIPVLGKVPITKITTSILNEFVKNKMNCGRLDKKGGLSAAYVRSMIIIIISALQYSVREGMRSPLITPAFKPIVENKELKILSPQEKDILINYVLNDIDGTKLGIFIALNCGLRIGEICALRWDDIDLENKVIKIRSTIARIKKKTGIGTVLILDRPKTKASIRTVPINSNLLSVLTAYKQIAVSEFVISNKASFVSPRTYDYRYHKILEKSGIEKINFHALRHTFATNCVMAGVDVKTLSEILGHSNVTITLNTYVHPSFEMKLKQIEKIAVYSA